MKILIAKERGYCYGVRDAMQEVISHTELQKKPINTYGPLIHNNRAIEELAQRHQIKAIEHIKDLESDTLAIRAHGISPQALEEFESQGIKIIDTTCPFVTKTQKIARTLKSEGYFVVILGKKEHPEVKGIAGHVHDKHLIIENAQDLQKLKRHPKIGIVFQSTVTCDDFTQIIPQILNYGKEIKIMKTICGVTVRRQKEVKELAKKVEMMLVIGGKNSSNTKKLTDLSRKQGVKTLQIESGQDIKEQDFPKGTTLGIITGTSTPQVLIDEIITELHKIEASEIIFNE